MGRSRQRLAGLGGAATENVSYVSVVAMTRSDDTFHLLDLESQTEAVQAMLAGRSLDEKIAWFEAHGKLSQLPLHFGEGLEIYAFESTIGFDCSFFIKGESLVFIGDNTTWSVPRPPAALRKTPTPWAAAATLIRRPLTRRPQ